MRIDSLHGHVVTGELSQFGEPDVTEQEIHSTTIAQLDWLVGGLGFSDRLVGKHFDGNSLCR
jgi:hypothetical protein